MKNIPKDLFCFLIKKEDINSIITYNYYSKTGKPIILTRFIDGRLYKSGDNSKVRSLKYYQKLNYRGSIRGDVENNKVDFLGLKLPNSGFKLRLNNFFNGVFIIELIHDSFNDLFYQPAVYLNAYKFTKLMNSCNGFMEDSILLGNYIMELITNRDVSFINDVEDRNIPINNLSIEIGNTLSITKRKTTDLIPGHFYCFDNKDIVLCIDNLQNIDGYFNHRRYSKSMPYSYFINDFTSTYSINVLSGYLVVPINCLSDNIINYFLKLRGKVVDRHYLINYIIQLFLNNDYYSSHPILGIFIKRDFSPAADIGNPINIVYSTSLNTQEIIHDIIWSNLANMSKKDDLFIKSFLAVYDISGKDNKFRTLFLDSLINHYSYTFGFFSAKHSTNRFEDFKKMCLGSLGKLNIDSKSLDYFQKRAVNIIKSLVDGIKIGKYLVKITDSELDYIINKIKHL